MHEMGLVRSALDVVLEACAGDEVEAVTKVYLSIGEFGDVVEEYIPQLFAFLARGTVAQGAAVEIAHVPVTVRCEACGEVFPIDPRDEGTLTCPRCSAYRRYRLETGTEFRIDRIVVRRRASDSRRIA